MRIARFRSGDESRLGVVVRTDGDTVEVVTIDHRFADAVAAASAGSAQVDEAMPGGSHSTISVSDLLAPVAAPGKLLCAAMNYHEHVAEVTEHAFAKSHIVPKLFLKPSTSLLAPSAELELPTTSDTVDWEIELGVVIGREARAVTVDEALDHVAGYCVVNDISARTSHWGMRTREPSHWADFFDWLMGKWPDGFAPIGPWLTTAEEVADPQALELSLTVNGSVRQSASTGQMIFTTAELIAFASTFMTLMPGDVIATGTPSGVGAASGTYLQPGDVMVGSVAGLGSLTTTVVAQQLG